MTEEQLNIPIYFLGAIDIRNDAKVVEVALTFARRFTPASFFRSQSGTIWARSSPLTILPRGRKLRTFPSRNRRIQKNKRFKMCTCNRNKDGLLWPYSERGLPNTATTARFTGPSPESPVGDEGKYRGRYKLVNTDDYLPRTLKV